MHLIHKLQRTETMVFLKNAVTSSVLVIWIMLKYKSTFLNADIFFFSQKTSWLNLHWCSLSRCSPILNGSHSRSVPLKTLYFTFITINCHQYKVFKNVSAFKQPEKIGGKKASCILFYLTCKQHFVHCQKNHSDRRPSDILASTWNTRKNHSSLINFSPVLIRSDQIR